MPSILRARNKEPKANHIRRLFKISRLLSRVQGLQNSRDTGNSSGIERANVTIEIVGVTERADTVARNTLQSFDSSVLNGLDQLDQAEQDGRLERRQLQNEIQQIKEATLVTTELLQSRLREVKRAQLSRLAEIKPRMESHTGRVLPLLDTYRSNSNDRMDAEKLKECEQGMRILMRLAGIERLGLLEQLGDFSPEQEALEREESQSNTLRWEEQRREERQFLEEHDQRVAYRREVARVRAE